MVVTTSDEISVTAEQNYDRASELKSFDDTKEGVKGLVDAGVTKIPRIFYHPADPDPDLEKAFDLESIQIAVPLIDLQDFDKDPIKRREIVERIKDASETWGFFQVVNHGIPVSVLEEMKNGVLRFHEQDAEVKREWYTRDWNSPVLYNSNFDLHKSKSANWRDTFAATMAPVSPKPEDLPQVCRDIMIEYSKQVMKLGATLLEFLAEALELNPNYLKDIGCAEGLIAICHCYPACPEPELTMGATRHADDNFMTVLLQDHIGGLQVLHKNQWVEVSPVHGALVVNIGNFLQLITNDRFKSSEHRVLANKAGPRVSVASFFSTHWKPSSRVYGPIKELLSPDNPPKYKETTVHDYVSYSMNRGHVGTSHLSHLRI